MGAGGAGKGDALEPDSSSFPGAAVALFAPGQASGTFDYFTLAIVGTESSSRGDYTESEDDQVLVNAIAADPNALGYFGYAYYLANKDKLKVVAIDSGRGCVMPSMQTVIETPTSRCRAPYSSTSRPRR